MSPLEMWGGVEATVNRIGDSFHNQLVRARHWEHPEDLDLFAGLGLRALRHPLLWELIAPDGLERADWAWFDQRLERVRALGIRPIAGLVHHGSGPRHTSLVSDDFAPGLEAFARACAERYPWVQDYTPINEPLTTARFSTLYGAWYPHAKDDALFSRAIVNECRATVLAMKQIRQVNPAARLIQTEDLGQITTTPLLASSGAFENERRWLSFDLLCGRVDPTHLFWRWLQKGVSTKELEFFLENPCPPDVMGINYYITSDRSLDERLELYAAAYHGGNSERRYADIESVRTPTGITGHEALLRQAWARYQLPLAITEVHLDATRDDQLRWLQEAWLAAQAARADGVDVRAVTAWSLLGAFDWNSLLTRQDNYYESGVFDLRAPRPRPTALAHMVKALSTEGRFDHPVLEQPGWWRREHRSTHNRPGHAAHFENSAVYRSSSDQPLLIVGGKGALGRGFAHACELRGLSYRVVTPSELDSANDAAVGLALDQLRPWAIVNTSASMSVQEAERDPLRCHREFTQAPLVLANAAEQRGLPVVTFSSDLVFDGFAMRPYVESDPVNPQTLYGSTQAEGERLVLESCQRGLIVRSGAFFDPRDQYSFVSRSAQQLRQGQTIHVTADELVSLTYLPDLVRITLDLLIDRAWGVWHLANIGVVSWSELGRHLATGLSRSTGLVVEAASTQSPPRPRCLALSSERATLMPPLETALARFLQEFRGSL